jgi:opacity protein-like surface antigen
MTFSQPRWHDLRVRTAAVISALFLTITVPTFAQGIQAKGVKIGVNLAQAVVDSDVEETLDNKTGVVAGGFVRFGMSGIAIQPEVLVSMKGGQQPAGSDEFALKLNYLEIPVLLRLGLPGGFSPFIVAGPAIGLRLSAKADPGNEDVKDDFKSTDVGIAVGGGIEVSSLSLEARFTQSLSDIVTSQGHSELVTGAVKNRVISFLLGIRF